MINLTLPRDKETQLNYGENYVLRSDTVNECMSSHSCNIQTQIAMYAGTNGFC